jgi:predicted secreted Zn-dependent protease
MTTNASTKEELNLRYKELLTDLKSTRNRDINIANAEISHILHELESIDRKTLIKKLDEANQITEKQIEQIKVASEMSERQNTLVRKQSRIMIWLTITMTILALLMAAFGGIEIWNNFIR